MAAKQQQEAAALDIDPRFLPPGITMQDYATLTPEQQHLVKQQALAYAQAHQQEELVDDEDDVPEQCKKAKAKRLNGLIEWITEREEHSFLVAVDRQFIKDKFNLIGLYQNYLDQVGIKPENLSEKQFSQYIKHIYKSKAPSPESLQDEKYVQFIQDIVDVYGMIHNRYIRSPQGKKLYNFHFLQVLPKCSKSSSKEHLEYVQELYAMAKNVCLWV